ncbi:hypothetical protein ACFL59_15855, partial [Planctomycetota bacterium]
AERTIQDARKEKQLLEIQTSSEIERADAAFKIERADTEAARERRETTAWAEVERMRMAVRAEQATHRLNEEEREREIEGRISEGEVHQKLVEALPEIAENVKVGDVRWYGGGGEDGSGPLGIVPKALEQVLSVAETHGVDLRDILSKKLEGGASGQQKGAAEAEREA